mmetsp:Transcript_29987/g.78661  ORF Transcript_29987/g.78661 Transcript_29987/m.78661 type:complete len:201 (+) Transcript_29987:878-1480(+)
MKPPPCRIKCARVNGIICQYCLLLQQFAIKRMQHREYNLRLRHELHRRARRCGGRKRPGATGCRRREGFVDLVLQRFVKAPQRFEAGVEGIAPLEHVDRGTPEPSGGCERVVNRFGHSFGDVLGQSRVDDLGVHPREPRERQHDDRAVFTKEILQVSSRVVPVAAVRHHEIRIVVQCTVLFTHASDAISHVEKEARRNHR